MLPPNQAFLAMVRPDGSAIGQNTGTVLVDTDTVQVSNTVAAGEVVGPTGNSISGGSVGVHLHLYSFPDGNFSIGDDITKDPLEFVEHDKPDYIIQVLKENDTTPGIDLVYPGNSTGTVQVRPKLPNAGNSATTYNTVYNVDSVKVLIKKDYEPEANYAPIIGPNKKALFSHGAKTGTQRYNIAVNATGNWTTTGMEPFAYSLHPWDDFYFADFATRVHKDDELGNSISNPNKFADCPDHARYNDGKYQVKAQIVNVVDEVQEGPNSTGELIPVEITIDNFMPFVSKVKVKLGVDTIYQRHWECKDDKPTVVGDGCIDLSATSEKPASDLAAELIVEACTSEPMQFMKALIPSLSTDTIEGEATDQTKMAWRFKFGSNLQLATDSCYTIIFVGKDCSNNSLLDLKAMAGSNLGTACVKIPKRQNSGSSANSWSPTANQVGKDDVHKFCIKSCAKSHASTKTSTDEECIDESDVTVAIQNANPGASDGGIDLTVNGGYYYTWTDENGNILSHNEDLKNVPAGTYCYEVLDGQCCSVSDCVVVGECPDLSGLAQIENPCPGQTNGYINLNTINGIAPYSFQWSNGATTQNISGLKSGIFCVTITDSQGCHTEKCYELYEQFTFSGTFTNACQQSQYGQIDLTVTPATPLQIFTYQWSNGANTQDISNLNAGNYCVTVTNGTGCTATKCFIVQNQLNLNANIASIQNSSYCAVYETGTTDQCNGSIDLQVSGGGTTTYSWQGPGGFTATTQDINGLCQGNYFVTITNAFGCSVVRQAELCCCESDWEPGGPGEPSHIHPNSCSSQGYVPEPLSISNMNITPPSAVGANNGALGVSLSGGFGGMVYYHWASPNGYEAFTSSISNLSPGTYCVTVTDGCATDSECVELVVCSQFPITINGKAIPTCPGVNFGAVSLSVSGGHSPFKFKWSNGSTSQNLSNLASGTYCVTVTDHSACTAIKCFSVGSNQGFTDIFGFPCSVTRTCNGNFVGIVDFPINCYYDNPFECTEYNCYCSFNGVLVETGNTEYVELYVNPDNCTLIGVCPEGGTEIACYGSFETGYTGGQTCSTCFWCAYVEGCYFAEYDYFYPTYVEYTEPAPVFSNEMPNCETGCGYNVYCGGPGNVYIGYVCSSCGGFTQPLVIDTTIEFTNDLKIGELYRIYQDSGLAAISTKLLLPEGIDKDDLVADYINYLNTNQDSLRKFSVFTREEIGEIVCDNRNCQVIFHIGGGSFGQGSGEKSGNELIVRRIFPNPTTNKVTIELESTNGQKVLMRLKTLTGQELLVQAKDVVKGLNIVSIDLKGLPDAVYIIEISDSDGIKSSYRVAKSR
jgi:hypothetical protein